MLHLLTIDHAFVSIWEREREMIITNWIRISFLILWEQQLWDWKTALITCPYPQSWFLWSVGCTMNPNSLNFKFCMQNFCVVVLGEGLQSLGQILSLWKSRFNILSDETYVHWLGVTRTCKSLHVAFFLPLFSPLIQQSVF